MSCFANLLSPKAEADALPFRFDAHNRRPPMDPVNAMLSLAYAMLARHYAVALASVGLDPYRGFYHGPRYGRPALALDMMEPFRPIIAESVMLSVVNTGEIGAGDFVVATTGTELNTAGRRFVEAFERRLSQEVTHPLFSFSYRVSMRRLLLVRTRLLSRFLLSAPSGWGAFAFSERRPCAGETSCVRRTGRCKRCRINPTGSMDFVNFTTSKTTWNTHRAVRRNYVGMRKRLGEFCRQRSTRARWAYANTRSCRAQAAQLFWCTADC